MDNCGSHGKYWVDARGRVTILTLPPNFTLLHQPMDMGVIAAWKSNYSLKVLNDIIVTMETQDERKRMDILNKLKAGMKVISEGHDPHTLDVSELVSRTWKMVSESTIARCWIKTGILPVTAQAELVSMHGKAGRNESHIEKAMIEEVVLSLSHLSIASESHSLGNQCFERQDVERWVNIESYESVVKAFVKDAMENFESGPGVTNTTTTQSSDEDGSAEDARERRTIPSIIEIAKLFGELEDLDTECQVSDALSYSAPNANKYTHRRVEF